jgi:hypothetical protein
VSNDNSIPSSILAALYPGGDVTIIGAIGLGAEPTMVGELAVVVVLDLAAVLAIFISIMPVGSGNKKVFVSSSKNKSVYLVAISALSEVTSFE